MSRRLFVLASSISAVVAGVVPGINTVGWILGA